MKNNQIAEKQHLSPFGSLQVNSIFLTIQGEGPFAGHPAIFVRLAGCNLQCPGCDTEYTGRSHLAVNLIVDEIKLLSKNIMPPLIVITGGEPFRQNLIPLVEKLLYENSYIVQIETNGTLYQALPFTHKRLMIVCSPKTGSVHKKLEPHIKAYKYVISADDCDEVDGLPLHALEHPCTRLARPKNFNAAIYLQAADEYNESKNAANLEIAVANSIKFGYIFCLQIHKTIDMP